MWIKGCRGLEETVYDHVDCLLSADPLIVLYVLFPVWVKYNKKLARLSFSPADVRTLSTGNMEISQG